MEKKLSSNFSRYLHFFLRDCNYLSCFSNRSSSPSVQSFIDSFLLKYRKLVSSKLCYRILVLNSRSQQLRGTQPSSLLLLSLSTFSLKQPRGVGSSFYAGYLSFSRSFAVSCGLTLATLSDWNFLIKSPSFSIDSTLLLLRFFLSLSVPYARSKWFLSWPFSFSPFPSTKQGLRSPSLSLDFIRWRFLLVFLLGLMVGNWRERGWILVADLLR